jgi:hypothetical protein
MAPFIGKAAAAVKCGSRAQGITLSKLLWQFFHIEAWATLDKSLPVMAIAGEVTGARPKTR